MSENVISIAPARGELSVRRHDAKKFLFGARLGMAPYDRSYPALTNVFTNAVDDIVAARPPAEHSKSPNERRLRRSGGHMLELFSRSVGIPHEPMKSRGDIARVDYAKTGHMFLWREVSELELGFGLYARSENFFVDSTGTAQLEVVLAQGFSYDKKIVLRESIPASEDEMRGMIKLLETSRTYHDNPPVVIANSMY